MIVRGIVPEVARELLRIAAVTEFQPDGLGSKWPGVGNLYIYIVF